MATKMRPKAPTAMAAVESRVQPMKKVTMQHPVNLACIVCGEAHVAEWEREGYKRATVIPAPGE